MVGAGHTVVRLEKNRRCLMEEGFNHPRNRNAIAAEEHGGEECKRELRGAYKSIDD